MFSVKNCEGSVILPYKLVYHSSMDVGRKHETPGWEKRIFLFTAVLVARVSTFLSVSQASLLPTVCRESDDTFTGRVLCYVGEEPWVFYSRQQTCSFFLCTGTPFLLQICLLYKQPWKDSPEQSISCLAYKTHRNIRIL